MTHHSESACSPRERADRRQWILEALAQFEAPLLRYTTRLLHGDLESARDVVQDTFMKLWSQDQDDLDPHLAPWLYRVCRNRALDLLRKERRMKTAGDTLADRADTSDRLERPATVPVWSNRPAHSKIDPIIDAPDEPQHSASTRAMRQAMRFLPDRQQEALRLKFQAGLSYRQMAEVMDTTVSNVGVLLHTAIMTLRRGLLQSQPAEPRDKGQPMRMAAAITHIRSDGAG